MNPLNGVIDTHVHSSPDVVARAQNDLELAQSAAEAGMRAIVLKSHHLQTSDRAQIAQHANDEIRVLGGLVLNATSCGGLNRDAVRANLSVGGRVVWLPTFSAEHHLRQVADSRETRSLRMAPVPVTDGDGAILDELRSILELVARHDAVLATGHVAPNEAEAIVDEARRVGVRRLVVTHPELYIIATPVDMQRRLAARGVYFERCYHDVGNSDDARSVLETARHVGIESTILASDLGQASNVAPVAGLAEFYRILRDVGMTDEEWDVMARQNASSLLGLDT